MMDAPPGAAGVISRFLNWAWDSTFGGLLLRRLFDGVSVDGRYFTWDGAGPLHRITVIREPVQLFEFHARLSRALWESALVKKQDLRPAFRTPGTQTGGVLVYETDKGRTWKRTLLGGAGAGPGRAELELVARRGDTAPSWCECGGYIAPGGSFCPDCGKGAPRSVK